MTTYDWTRVSRDRLEHLAAIVDTWEAQRGQSPAELWAEIVAVIKAARAEAAPRLRTRAEVDAEIVDRVRSSARSLDELGFAGIAMLCAEPLAPEPEMTLAQARAAALASVPEPETPEPDPCSCEEAEALHRRLDAVRAILREIGAPGLTLENRKAHALGAVTRIWAAVGGEP